MPSRAGRRPGGQVGQDAEGARGVVERIDPVAARGGAADEARVGEAEAVVPVAALEVLDVAERDGVGGTQEAEPARVLAGDLEGVVGVVGRRDRVGAGPGVERDRGEDGGTRWRVSGRRRRCPR